MNYNLIYYVLIEYIHQMEYSLIEITIKRRMYIISLFQFQFFKYIFSITCYFIWWIFYFDLISFLFLIEYILQMFFSFNSKEEMFSFFSEHQWIQMNNNYEFLWIHIFHLITFCINIYVIYLLNQIHLSSKKLKIKNQNKKDNKIKRKRKISIECSTWWYCLYTW